MTGIPTKPEPSAPVHEFDKLGTCVKCSYSREYLEVNGVKVCDESDVKSSAPVGGEPNVTAFTYLLNAMENAAQQDRPADHGYADKRQAVMQFVRELAVRSGSASSPQPDIESDTFARGVREGRRQASSP